MTFIIMGVSGCGKSTIGCLLAQKLSRVYVEGDDYHPPENIAKMASGLPLDNNDRRGWIAALCQAVNSAGPSVVACSALNGQVRDWLKTGLNVGPRYIYLDGSEAKIAARLSRRKDHFFDPALLASQFAALDVPGDALRVSIDAAPETITESIINALNEN